MKTSDFDFNLPDELIAQHPNEKRDHSKLLSLNKNTNEIEHCSFYQIVDYLNKDDCLVINNTKVIPARLIGEKKDTNALIEILLLKEVDKDHWEALAKPAKRIKVGTIINFAGLITAECVAVLEEGIRIFKFSYQGIFLEVLEKLGTMPLPPYIKEKLTDNNRYQTVYASISGSAAAPTAGLHFTEELLNRIKEKGVMVLEITLHVGLGTFRPVVVDDVNSHKMHQETYIINEDVAKKLNEAIKFKKRIIACGTTTVRTLESNYQNGFKAGTFNTDIFIYPPYKFKVVDAIITNFHLPKSTLLMLISAFSNKDSIMKAYNEAINRRYRFFSFGDAMFIY
ncbi:tRNA preQ1(34) S-adenosylmethionine ribosyltransferase-isomerase QueA [Acholeplasma sp. OttesenSCG-928-E16]|nr:tRNA preQ1(34) S-adenosylmethionine ribosyltransferase-isomerase QueA [Acholeplasma sp. OttesenSCG-928-E16]